MTAATTAPFGSRPRIVVTGFGPFQGYRTNPSSVLADAMAETSAFGFDFVGSTVDTSWRRAWPAIRELVAAHRPKALVMLGVAPDPFFRLEVRAHNALWAELDIDGICPIACGSSVLVSGAPRAYYTTLPFRALCRVLRLGHSSLPSIHGIPASRPSSEFKVRMSADAGRFICNQVYYLALHRLRGLVPYIGFIHVPPAPVGDGDGESGFVEFGRFLLERLALTLMLKEVGFLQTISADRRPRREHR